MKKEVLKDNMQHDYLLIKLKTTKIKNILSYQRKARAQRILGS